MQKKGKINERENEKKRENFVNFEYCQMIKIREKVVFFLLFFFSKFQNVIFIIWTRNKFYNKKQFLLYQF